MGEALTMNGPAAVSVIIPCYCCSKVLPRAVDSVLSQLLLPAELILVDDASPDQGETKRCIERIVSEHSFGGVVRVRPNYLETNLGPGGARNAGWDIASQPYIAFLDADDAWAVEKLATQYPWMLRHPEYALSCHESVLENSAAAKVERSNSIKFEEITAFSLLLKNCIPTRTVMMRRQAQVRFPPEMRFAEDYFLWLNMVLGGSRLVRLKIPMAFSFKQDYGEGGLSGNLLAMHMGVLACYDNLRHKRVIGPVTFLAAQIWEKLKYFKRRVVVRFARWKNLEQ
jgi:glycosyltransferase involved in cell wall biosynthesis